MEPVQNVGTKISSFGNNDDVVGVYLNLTVSEANKIC